MQHGDISNGAPARLLVVFEGLVGVRAVQPAPPPPKRLWRRPRPPAPPAPGDFRVNALARDAIRDAVVRGGWHVDVITALGEEFAADLADWLPGQMVHAPVLPYEPGALARDLAHRQDVHAIYFPDRANAFTFGHWGRHTPAHRAYEIGRS